jgi:endogenous inhibitor of DNA gyrase (YacG/DUF329 family)
MERPCPTCGEPARWEDNPDRPFCSERCRDVDLGRWATEDYRVDAGNADTAEFDEDESGAVPEDFQPS